MQLLVRGIAYLLTMKMFAGHRTEIFGAGQIIYGLALIVLAAGTDAGTSSVDPEVSVKSGIEWILLGGTTLGVGGRLWNMIASMNANTIVVAADSEVVPTVTSGDANRALRNLPGPVPGNPPSAGGGTVPAKG